MHHIHEEVDDDATVAEATGGAAEKGGAVGRGDGLEACGDATAGVGVGVAEVEHRRVVEIRRRRRAPATEAEDDQEEQHHGGRPRTHGGGG